MGIPGLDRERSFPGPQYVERLKSKRQAEPLRRLYGDARTELILEHGIDPMDLYRPDNTLMNFDELIERGVVSRALADEIGGALAAAGRN
ncbi:MAG: hypothetical protein ACYTEQ_16675 [Planctomycetota bacterium]